MNFGELMSKRYDAHNYHCGHFTVDAWEMVTGEDASAKLAGLLVPLDCVKVAKCTMSKCHELRAPKSPCFAVMTNALGDRHLGVFLDGRILHITETYPEMTKLNLATRMFKKVQFYEFE